MNVWNNMRIPKMFLFESIFSLEAQLAQTFWLLLGPFPPM